MGFLDGIKKGFEDTKKGIEVTTGFNLKATEHIDRAYTKGVFIKDYKSASKDFLKASEKFNKDNNAEMELHARANSAIYGILGSRDRSNMSELIALLEMLPEIEQIGSDKNIIGTTPLVTELKAIQLEFQAEQTQATGEKKQLYAQASDLLMTMGAEVLSFADKLGLSGPTDKALLRAYYYGAMSDYYSALTEAAVSPSYAHDYLQKSAVRFRQAGTPDWEAKVEGYLDQIKAKRHCWMCGREMQGRNIFYQYYPARTAQYHKNLIENSGGDAGMLDTDSSVTLCTVCGTAIENQADLYAIRRTNELREWVTPILDNHKEILENHSKLLNELASLAHRHT